MYNPQINTVGPMLIAQGFSNAANSTLQGAEAMAKGISSAGSSIAGGIAGYGDAKTAETAKYNQALGGLGATYDNADYLSQTTGIDADFIRNAAKGAWENKDKNAVIGAFDAHNKFLEMAYKNNIVNTQMSGRSALASQVAAQSQAQASAKPQNVGVSFAPKPSYFGN